MQIKALTTDSVLRFYHQLQLPTNGLGISCDFIESILNFSLQA